MQPAFNILLSDDDLKLLGELCAIQGQIEMLMSNIVSTLLALPVATANKILGSTNARANADIWIAIVRNKCQHEELRQKAEAIYAAMPDVFESRNFVVHALYGHESGPGFYALYSSGVSNPNPVVAVRRRDQKVRSASQIREARDAAAKLSQELHALHEALFLALFARSPSPDR